MGKHLFGKMCVVISVLLLFSSEILAQRDSIFYKDDKFVLYSNGIFKTCSVPKRGYDFLKTSGIWTKVQDSLIRLKSFDEYKCEVLNVQAYYDSTISVFEIEVYATDGKRMFHNKGKDVFNVSIDEFKAIPTITPGPYCSNYFVDTTKYNHFVFVVKSKWNYEDIYIDQLFKITPEGLKWVKISEL